MLWVNGKPIEKYHGKLKDGWQVKGVEITDISYSHMRNRSTLQYHTTELGLKAITFSVDFTGPDEHMIAWRKSLFDAEIHGKSELVLPDGFMYSAVCNVLGEELYHGREIIEAAYELSGIRHGPEEVVAGNRIFCESNIDYAMLTSTSEFGALLDALDTVNGLTVIDPANATASDIGMPADAYYTGQALENHETRIAANETAISQQNENFTEYNTKLNNYVTRVALTMPNASFAANAQSESVGDVTSVVPSGYKAITVIPRHSMNANLVWTVCVLNGNTVTARLRNVSTSAVTAGPVVDVLCIKS